MLRSILRTTATAAKSHRTTSVDLRISAVSVTASSRTFAAGQHRKKLNLRPDIKPDNAPSGAKAAETLNKELRARALKEDEKDKSVDVGPNGRPLFTSATSISELTKKDTCTYMKFRREELESVLPEGLPTGMLKEFNDSMRDALLIRQSFLDLRDNFRRVVDPTLQSNAKGLKTRKQVVLDGAVSCGKSIALAMLVNWARDEGWLVLYVPKGREWTHGGFFYKNPKTGLWDTPVQAANALQARKLKSMVSCRVDRQEDVITAVQQMEIGWPTNVQHLTHVTFDRFHGFLGLPVEFQVEIPCRVPSASISVFGVSAESMQCSYDTRGNKNSQEEHVRDQLNRGIVPEDIDVHCLAGLIKAWFRELPSGVLDGLSPEQVLQCNMEAEFVELVKHCSTGQLI
ncbi:Rho GTPase-activating protein 2 [Capsicum annuum]|uniref:Rho GTPase-activating protein 2 n=1 Tax=Capsicum annuum TaxID=4072 RepID=A0A2G2Y039_CAPAN|nr:Rho GTPase-activating protein 2 [Capsicum annuum]